MSSALSTPQPVEPTVTLAPVPLPELLATITDHPHRRGIRHRLDVLLAVPLAAVAAGAKSYTVIVDIGVELHRRPSEPTLRRALSQCGRRPAGADHRRMDLDEDGDPQRSTGDCRRR